MLFFLATLCFCGAWENSCAVVSNCFYSYQLKMFGDIATIRHRSLYFGFKFRSSILQRIDITRVVVGLLTKWGLLHQLLSILNFLHISFVLLKCVWTRRSYSCSRGRCVVFYRITSLPGALKVPHRTKQNCTTIIRIHIDPNSCNVTYVSHGAM